MTFDLDAHFQVDERTRDRDVVLKYNPNQPRHPKGSREGGRFASGSSASSPSTARTSGWTTRVTDFSTSVSRIEKALPNADVFVDSTTHDDVAAGVAEASARFAERYPEIAAHVIGLRIGNRTITTSAGDMETTISTIRKKDGSMATGFVLLVNNEAMGPQGFKEYVTNSRIEDGEHYPDGSKVPPWNSSPATNLADWSAASMTHEYGHVVHNWSTAKGAERPVFRPDEHPAYNPEVWNDLVPGHAKWIAGRDVPALDPDNDALHAYVERAAAIGVSPPSQYAGSNTAELFAESYTARHGPADMRVSTLDPTLETIVAKIEQDAYADVDGWSPAKSRVDADYVLDDWARENML
jgi:hypothetical protein